MAFRQSSGLVRAVVRALVKASDRTERSPLLGLRQQLDPPTGDLPRAPRRFTTFALRDELE